MCAIDQIAPVISIECGLPDKKYGIPKNKVSSIGPDVAAITIETGNDGDSYSGDIVVTSAVPAYISPMLITW